MSPGLRAVQIANHLTGVPYRWGGASPRAGFDCSGLVQYVYSKVGIPLPHYAAGQYGHGRRVSRGALKAGDLVFFSGLGHVGIYAGGGKFIHAPRRGTMVRWSRLSSHGSYYGATRLSQPRAACRQCRRGRRRAAAVGRSPASRAPGRRGRVRRLPT